MKRPFRSVVALRLTAPESVVTVTATPSSASFSTPVTRPRMTSTVCALERRGSADEEHRERGERTGEEREEAQPPERAVRAASEAYPDVLRVSHRHERETGKARRTHTSDAARWRIGTELRPYDSAEGFLPSPWIRRASDRGR